MNPEQAVADAAWICQQENWPDSIAEKTAANLIKKVVAMGHTSILEHASYQFRIQGISRACYDNKTEIYTENGWKLFRYLGDTEKVLTRNRQGVAEFELPVRHISYLYQGNLHYYNSQNVNLAVTPNHRMLIKKYDIKDRKTAEYNLVPSEEITVNRFYITKKLNTQKTTISHVIIPGIDYLRKNRNGELFEKNVKDLTIDAKTFVKFLAWYLAEGSCFYNKTENSYTISISQYESEKNTENRKEIIELITKMGFTATTEPKVVKFKNRQVGQFVKQLGLSFEKYIPDSIFSALDKSLAADFISTYSKADASVDKTGHVKLYTCSRKLADQLQILAFLSGTSASIWEDDRVREKHLIKGNEVTHNHICYVVSISQGVRNIECVVKRNKHFRESAYNGYVYCVEVPNNVIFVRRNGIAQWCGNCSHQLVRYRVGFSPSQQSQRYVKLNVDNDVFPWVIPDSIANDPGKKEDMLWLLTEIEAMYSQWVSDGIPEEDARFILPNAAKTKLSVTMNARALHHFFSQRCCTRSQWEIRNLAMAMWEECMKVSPTLFEICGPPCLHGKCPEGAMSCGKPWKG
jgi:thymidylate synthase ThyX